MSQQRIREIPGNRPCAACDRPMSENARHWHAGPPSGVIKVICTPCFHLGFRFDVLGNVGRWRVSDPQAAVRYPPRWSAGRLS